MKPFRVKESFPLSLRLELALPSVVFLLRDLARDEAVPHHTPGFYRNIRFLRVLCFWVDPEAAVAHVGNEPELVFELEQRSH